MKKALEKNTQKRTKVVGSKLSEDEYEEVINSAEKCGITVSRFIRKRILGYSPQARMTTKEYRACLILDSARGDFMHFKNALRAVPKELRKSLFGDENTMNQWLIHAAITIEEIDKFLKRVRE